MRYNCLATDYDGTLALHGHVLPSTVAAMERLKKSGRSLVMVTGRELEELLGIFPEIGMFDWVVAENGALLYEPKTRDIRSLADPPERQFVDKLRERGVAKLSVGRVIVATWEPYETLVLDVIRDLGLGLQVIFNKGAVMVLPSGVTKATGLKAALNELGLSRHNVVAVGDAENDHAFLNACEFGVAVSNALPALKERADWTTRGDHGDGVIELIDQMIADDLSSFGERLTRHDVVLGRRDGRDVPFRPHGHRLFIGGSSGSGKSSLAVGIAERLGEADYQFCIVDPEGDFCTLEHIVAVGTKQQPPSVDEALQVLHKPKQSVVVNLEAVAGDERPEFFSALVSRLAELRARKGRPHWLLVDEAEQVLPAKRPLPQPLAGSLQETMLIAVDPRRVAAAALAGIDTAIAVGEHPEQVLADFAAAAGDAPLRLQPTTLHSGEALVHQRGDGREPFVMQIVPARCERRRQEHKFVFGDLGPDHSFVFRGPLGKLKLRARNLSMFVEMAEGVDDETWLHHLQQGDYSRWFREGFEDRHLSDEAARIETQPNLSADESRHRLRHIIEKHYTLANGE